MSTVDYSKYTSAELLQAESTLNAELYPENHKALMKEIDNRDFSVDVKAEKEKKVKTSLNRVKIVGWLQIASAATLLGVVIYYAINNDIDLLSGIMIFLLGLINAFAGYTALKKQYKWYWLSIANQSLQAIGFSLGKLIYSYNAIGGIYFYVSTTHKLQFGFNAEIRPGFYVYYLSQSIPAPSIKVDVLAIIMIIALVTAYKHHTSSDHQKS